MRYYDVSPWYGLGLAERRYGAFLHDKPRDSYLLSTKVGKLLKASPQNKGKELFPFANSPNDVVFDYSADGVRRSIEDSLQRLGVDRIDVVFVHDISPDNKYLPRPWTEEFEVALKGAFPALSKMRDEGIIKAWGMGVNTPEPILRAMREADPDVCLLASQYSLVDHAKALHEVFPVAREARRRLRGRLGAERRLRFRQPALQLWRRAAGTSRATTSAKRERLRAVAGEFGVDLRTAALQFSSAPDVALALIVGARNADQALKNASAMQDTVPPAFWDELKRQGLIEADAPVPGR